MTSDPHAEAILAKDDETNITLGTFIDSFSGERRFRLSAPDRHTLHANFTVAEWEVVAAMLASVRPDSIPTEGSRP